MSRDLEIEAKYLVNQDDFQKLITYFNLKETDFVAQTNYYLDNKNLDLIRKHHMVFRLRNRGDYWEATLKLPEYKHLVEINQRHVSVDIHTLDLNVLSEIMPHLKKIAIDINSIQIQGSLTTKRARIKYQGGNLDLDISHYRDMVDYEVEYEVESNLDEAKRIVEELFTKNNITSYKLSIAKMKRCLNIKD